MYDIKKRRTELGLTLQQIGDEVGVGASTVRKWEQGMIKNMKRDKISLLAKVLQINPLQLTEDENIEYQPEIETSETEDISTKLEKMMQQLSDQKEALMFRGEPMDDETKEAVWLAMQQAMKFAEMSMRKEASKKEE